MLWAVIWALALIGSAFVFKGNPIKDCIQLGLLVVGVTVWLGSGNLDDKLAFVAD